MGMPKSSGASTEAIGGVDEEYELPPKYYDDEEFGRGVRMNTNMGMPKSSGASTETIGGVDEDYELPLEYYDDATVVCKVSMAAKDNGVPVIADSGIANSGHIVKIRGIYCYDGELLSRH